MFYYNYTIDNQISHICQNDYNYFFQKKNVLGLGLGYKYTNGFYTNQKCIKVFVIQKICKDKILQQNIIPKYYKGFLTDVCETGAITSYSLSNRIRPVPGGYSIGPVPNFFAGSMGCLVTDGKYNYILGNNHVLSYEGDVPIGSAIIQPANVDGGKAPKDIVANLFKLIPIKYKGHFIHPINYVDCAIARVSNPSLVSSEIAIIGQIKGTSHAVLNENVQKVGRVTELTYGKVLATSSTLDINFRKGQCLFKNQIITNKMGDTGDSGAILLDLLDKAQGLLIGGSNSTSIFNPIDAILSALGVSIVTN